MEYITVGTDTILREYMCDIIDTERIIKPAGGIWCTDFDVKRPYNCDWINYMIYNTSVLMAKTMGRNPFSHKAAIMKLNDDAKVFSLAGNEDYDKFLSFYAKDGHISYEALRKDYDGVYVDIGKPFGKSYDEREKVLRLFAVNTFLLFNIDAIKSYRQAKIEIDPFDYEGYMEMIPDYTIEVLDGEHKVKDLSEGYKYLLQKVIDYYDKHYQNDGNVSHNQMVSIIYNEIMNLFEKDLSMLKNREQLDEKSVAKSMATRVLSRKI